MPLHAPTNASTYIPAPAGLHSAICVDVVDLGDITDKWGTKRKLQLSWLIGFAHPDTGFPMLVTKRYTFSMHEKSNLFRDISGWRGKVLTEKEAGEFDFDNVLLKPALLNVMHRPSDSGDTIYANVTAVLPMKEGEVPDASEYVRHIYRAADQNPKDVRNQAFQEHTEQTPAPNGHDQKAVNTFPTPVQESKQEPVSNAPFPDDDLPF